jgi:hypothetical protein
VIVVAGSILLVSRWRREAPPASRPDPGSRIGGAEILGRQEPDLRMAIERALAAYRKALETGSASALEAARPDLDERARAVLLGPYRGALKVSVELSVLDVARQDNLAEVRLRRTSVTVGGVAPPPPPTEETLRLVRRGGVWAPG